MGAKRNNILQVMTGFNKEASDQHVADRKQHIASKIPRWEVTAS